MNFIHTYSYSERELDFRHTSIISLSIGLFIHTHIQWPIATPSRDLRLDLEIQPKMIMSMKTEEERFDKNLL